MASDIRKARTAEPTSGVRRHARPATEDAPRTPASADEDSDALPENHESNEADDRESTDAKKSAAESDDAPDESPPVFSGLRMGRNFLHKFGACFFSMVVHAGLLLTMALWMAPEETKTLLKEIVAHLVEEQPEDELLKIDLDEQIQAAQETAVAVVSSAPEAGVSSATVGGGGSTGGISAPQMDRGVIEQLADTGLSIDGPFTDAPPSRVLIGEIPDGALGDPRAVVDNYQEAMDQITQEILWMLTKGKVLVVWCFDESESMKDDQREIRQRIDRVYTELGLTSKANGDSLATAITSYGENFRVHTKRPTSDLDEIRKAIDQVPVDPSGKEMMCQAVGRSILQHRDYARRTDRQIALVLVTDESGDPKTNNEFLEQAIAEAKAAHCRVYVLGREAVFGYPYAHISWTHPQTGHTHWLPIDRGPETAFVEQLQTDGFHRRYDAHPSGFGPYEQTRLAQQSGGIFFMLPSLESNLVRGEKRRYELEAMRSYLPDMRARIEVVTDRDRSHLRMNLWKVIYELNPYVPEISKIIEMRVHYAPIPDEFLKQAREDQRKAIIYLDYLAKAERAVAKLQFAREQEVSPRWQANYDLLYAQLVAYQARIYEYGAYLEWFIHNPKQVPFTKPPNLTLVRWDIGTRKEILVPEKSQPYIDRATVMFHAVIKEHAGTPWAARAQAELARGFGVQLHEVYHPPYPTIPTEKLIPIPKF